jgi:hypothetical protein
VIEHIENAHEFLVQAGNYLKNNGLVFITVPAYNFLWSNEDKDSGHYRRYTLKSMQRTLAGAGYNVIYSTYIFSVLPLPIFLSRTLPSVLGRNKNSHDKEKLSSEHKANSKNILDKIWNAELRTIKQGGKIPFGSSCLVVATKKSVIPNKVTPVFAPEALSASASAMVVAEEAVIQE